MMILVRKYSENKLNHSEYKKLKLNFSGVFSKIINIIFYFNDASIFLFKQFILYLRIEMYQEVNLESNLVNIDFQND